MEKKEKTFNLITHELPETVTIAGKKERIFTSTAIAMDCIEVLQEPSYEETIKALYIVERMYPRQNFTDEEKSEALARAIDFLNGAPTPEYEKANLPHSGERAIYWSLDSPAITASFRQAYNITLDELRRLHWWEFLALLYNIPSETRLGALFHTRSETIDMTKKPEQQTRQREIKKSARPKDERPKEEKQKSAVKSLVDSLA